MLVVLRGASQRLRPTRTHAVAISAVAYLAIGALLLVSHGSGQAPLTIAALPLSEYREVLTDQELASLLSPADLATLNDDSLPDPVRLEPLAKLPRVELGRYLSAARLQILSEAQANPAPVDGTAPQDTFGLLLAVFLAWLTAAATGLALLDAATHFGVESQGRQAGP